MSFCDFRLVITARAIAARSNRLPLHQEAGPSEASAEAKYEYAVALMEDTLIHAVRERERNRCGDGIAYAADVGDPAILADAAAIDEGLDDALVGLVDDYKVDIADGELGLFNERGNRF